MPGPGRIPAAIRERLPKAALYLMVGCILGFLFFYDLFPFFCVPPSRDLPVWLLIITLCALGLAWGYLYPDINQVLTGALLLPALGAIFCFLLNTAPALSPDIVASGLSEDFVGMSFLLMPYMVITFLTFFITGFISMYHFESQ